MDEKKGREEEQVTERLIRLEFARIVGRKPVPDDGWPPDKNRGLR